MTKHRVAALTAGAPLLSLSLACGGGSASPASPSSPAAVTFHVYDSALGEMSAATFSRNASASGDVTIVLSDLSIQGVDRYRAVVREVHQGDRVGAFVARTTSGTLTARVVNGATYDLFLMSTGSSVDYSCLDYMEESVSGASSDFPTLGRRTQGTIFNHAVVDGPDAPIAFAVSQFNTALNPFGIRYGAIQYLGATTSAADMYIGWSTAALLSPTRGYGGGGMAIVAVDGVNTNYDTLWYGQVGTVVHELGHAYLGAPDYLNNTGCFGFAGNLSCVFLSCAVKGTTFSAVGADAARYWALTNRRKWPTY
jgi:hypothetical protein